MSVGLLRSKYGQGNLEGNRFKTHSNGTLEIKRIQVEDQGTYLCIVSNIAGRDENQVRIEVKGESHTVFILIIFELAKQFNTNTF